MIRNTKNRSGITLLFVISMIVLFLLMGSSFVIMTSQFRRSSDDFARVATRRDDARALINRAFYDLFRGPSLDDLFSPLRGHSILGDQYGYGMRAFVRPDGISVVPGTEGQLYRVFLDTGVLDGSGNTVNPPGEQFQDVLSGRVSDFSTQGGTYDGQVLTFTSGPAEGISTRIVNYQVEVLSERPLRSFIIMPQWDDSSGFVPDNLANLDNSGVLINGRAFAGSGAGIFTADQPLRFPALSTDAYNMNQTGIPRAILLSTYLARRQAADLTNVDSNPASINEDYDAPDYQNAFLGGIGDLNGDGVVQLNEIIRSFDRPALRRHPGGNSRGKTFSVSGVPSADTGGDAALVDNDGDGLADGIWMDIGLPVQTDTRGRVYKPLVSYFVIDMDGKINVNAHGQLADLSANGFIPTRTQLLNNETPVNFGRGLGPAEVTLGAVFPADSTGLIQQRYGTDGVPGTGALDPLIVNKWFGHPDQSPLNAVDGLFGSPLDAMGRFGNGTPNLFSASLPVDPFDSTSGAGTIPTGMPIVDWRPDAAGWGAVFGLGTEIVNIPYEMSFRDEANAPSGGIDTPYSAREMERVLRRFDSDAVMLPPRLRQLTSSTLNSSASAQHAFTHASYEVPVPPTNVVTDLRNRILSERDDMDPTNMDEEDETFVNANVLIMLSPDVIHGLKMDPNRPFGNGRDDDGNDIVDQSWHDAVDAILNEANEEFRTLAGPVPFARDGFGAPDINFDAHQVFARHLYVLTLLTTEVDMNADGVFNAADWHEYDGVGGVNIDDIYAYRTDVAQWAINVANFRDRDSIMNPFEFDLEPFDGWDVDHVLNDTAETTLTRVVWGVERPEMLISEVMGNHDRATEDREDDNSALEVDEKRTMNHPTDPGTDPTLDSRFAPRASVFLEFYNPWISGQLDSVVNNANQTYPTELYAIDPATELPTGIDLTRTSMDGSSPVWQVAITDSRASASFIDDGSLVEDQILRRVYFTEPDATLAGAGAEYTGNKVYFPDSAIAIGSLAPGGHAVVGSAGVQEGDQYHTYLGLRSDNDLQNNRRITLDVGNSTVEQVYFDTGANQMETTATPAVVIPIGAQAGGGERSLGVTDPVDGYPGVVTNANGFQVVAGGVVLDTPFDATNPELQDDGQSLLRIVHLRRLANPLAPFDAVRNPYLTIDTLGMPINIFNGQSNVNEDGMSTVNGAGERINPLSIVSSRERGSNSSANGERILWASDQNVLSGDAQALYPATDLGAIAGAPDPHFHAYNFSNSLGTLDVAYRRNASAIGFPALTWNNRPFVSHLELMNVPFTSSYRLLNLFDVAPTQVFIDYRAQGSMEFGRPGGAGRFPHLFGFFADTSADINAEVLNSATNLSRLMDYLEVPSRFIGTETFLNPTVFNSAGSAGSLVGLGLNAPFNRVSNFRYPGKININTIFDPRVWNGLMRSDGLVPGNYGTQVPFTALRNARLNSNQQTPIGPSNFLNPFRSARSANYVAEQNYVVRSAETGLFRRFPGRAFPLFDYQADVAANTAIDPVRSAQFRYDMRQRLGNLVTTRSSVFSIWITVGFFEIDLEASNDVAGFNPGDIVFGEEVGSDTGDVQRYRGFYMVDRSIPVACEPGTNHNCDQAILASSIIQRAETN